MARERTLLRLHRRLRRLLRQQQQVIVRLSQSPQMKQLMSGWREDLRMRFTKEYWQSYETLVLQMQSLCKTFSEKVDLLALAGFSAREKILNTLDDIDLLDDIVLECRLIFEQQVHEVLVRLLEIFDAIQRMRLLKLPQNIQEYSQTAQEMGVRLQQALRQIELRVRLFLRKQGVRRIELQVGQSAPVEYTRLVHCEGNNSGNVALIIHEIVEEGYWRHGKILRKAAVIVSVQK